jgi:DNA ligase D
MASTAEELDVDGIAVRLTSPDKVYFPQLGSKGTKRTMVDYYLAVADRMVTLLRDRPTHLQRFPDGIEGEEIYQKRVPVKHPEYLETCTVTFPSGRTADALKVTHPSAIIWAAQMGTITLHPWQVRCPDVEHPDELRIDLDPQPGTGFKEAREIATGVLKPILEELGLTGYPKTSGGRGVHVFVRIKPDWDFIAVRRAGIALAREVERRAPDAVTTSWWKEERGERLFIDYNQNARDRTFASAYSVRKTPIATVSTPLSWVELADADPDDYTMATVPSLLAQRDDPWAGIDDLAHSLEPLLEMVQADEDRGLGDLPYPGRFSGKWVCAGVSWPNRAGAGLRSRSAERCRSGKEVDSTDDDRTRNLAGRVLGRSGRV